MHIQALQPAHFNLTASSAAIRFGKNEEYDELEARLRITRFLRGEWASQMVSSMPKGMQGTKHFTIGTQNSTITIPTDDQLSERHAQISLDGYNKWWVRDLGSNNKTYINGEPITTPNKDYQVNARDLLQVGRTRFRVPDDRQLKAILGRHAPPLAKAIASDSAQISRFINFHLYMGSAVKNSIVIQGPLKGPWALSLLPLEHNPMQMNVEKLPDERKGLCYLVQNPVNGEVYVFPNKADIREFGTASKWHALGYLNARSGEAIQIVNGPQFKLQFE